MQQNVHTIARIISRLFLKNIQLNKCQAHTLKSPRFRKYNMKFLFFTYFNEKFLLNNLYGFFQHQEFSYNC